MTETLALNSEELKEYIVTQTINHGIEVMRLTEEIATLKNELIQALRDTINGNNVPPFKKAYTMKRINELER